MIKIMIFKRQAKFMFSNPNWTSILNSKKGKKSSDVAYQRSSPFSEYHPSNFKNQNFNKYMCVCVYRCYMCVYVRFCVYALHIYKISVSGLKFHMQALYP